MIFVIGKVAASLTGAGIGIGTAYKFKSSQLVVVSAATAGMAGAFAGKLLAGTVLVEGNMIYAGPGEPLGAFIAAYVGIELGQFVTGWVLLLTGEPSSSHSLWGLSCQY